VALAADLELALGHGPAAAAIAMEVAIAAGHELAAAGHELAAARAVVPRRRRRRAGEPGRPRRARDRAGASPLALHSAYARRPC